MATILASTRASAFQTLRLIARTSPSTLSRALSTLPNNPHIVRTTTSGTCADSRELTSSQYLHSTPSSSPTTYTLSYLSTTPPISSLAIGTSTASPPTPDSFTPNPHFLALLHSILAEHAASDPDVQAQAQIYVSSAGSALGSGGAFFPSSAPTTRAASASGRGGFRKRTAAGGGGGGGGGADGAGGASAQGGIGGGGRGGWVHVSDTRNPPDYGRVAWPEDIFGSLEIDAQGRFVDGTGRYQSAGTYRVVTREGVLGLSEYLRERVVERLKELEKTMKAKGG